MLSPRVDLDDMPRRDLRYLGGTENFDIWLRVAGTDRHVYPLRLHRVAGEGKLTWDTFSLPLRKNTEIDQSLPPLERRYSGYWNDIILTHEDIERVETYLTCFAPEVMAMESEE